MRRDRIARRQVAPQTGSDAALHRKRWVVILAGGGALAASILLVVYQNYSGVLEHQRIVETERPAAAHTAPSHAKGPIRTAGAATVVTMDLRPFITERGLTPQQINGSLQLPRTVVTLSIQLPWGSDDGSYHLSLRTDSKTVITAKGTAKISNGVTILTVPNLDLSKLSPGQYTLAYKRQGDASHYATVHLND